jgi:hypothetical protein
MNIKLIFNRPDMFLLCTMYRIRAKLYVKRFCAHSKTILDHRWCLPEFFYLLLGQINGHLKQRTVQRKANWSNISLPIVNALFSIREGGQGWDTK